MSKATKALSALRAISGRHTTITIDGEDFEVFGLSGAAIVDLMFRFPEVKSIVATAKEQLAAGKGVLAIIDEIDPSDLLALGEDVVGAAIAWALHAGTDDEAEGFARDLPASAQILILKASFQRTFPDKLEGFLKALGLSLASEADESESQTDSNSGSQN